MPQDITALVVDDDAITLRFFEAALRDIGVRCVATENGRGAIGRCMDDRFDILLIDRHLPDMSGDALLRALRERNVVAPAIGTSAEVDDRVRADLIDAGFDEVVAKPISVAALREALARFVTIDDGRSILDDGTALAAVGGDANALRALRLLLADEIDGLDTTSSMENPDAFVDRLHRLRASCGFCGAVSLAEAAVSLQTTIRSGIVDPPAWARFADACRTTSTALRAPS